MQTVEGNGDLRGILNQGGLRRGHLDVVAAQKVVGAASSPGRVSSAGGALSTSS